MKHKIDLAWISRTVLLMRKYVRSKRVSILDFRFWILDWLLTIQTLKSKIQNPNAPLRAGFCILIVCAAFAAARAQVVPSVCFEAKPETLERTLTNAVVAGPVDSPQNPAQVNLNQAIPAGFHRVVFDPGGPTQEILIGNNNTGGAAINMSGSGNPGQAYLHPHPAGQRVDFITEGDAVYGYNNLNGVAVTIPRGVSQGNFFSPGPVIYSAQPSVFQPGVRGDVMRLKAFAGASNPTWFLNGAQAISNAAPVQNCAAITYQGRLTDAGLAASGQYDLQIQAFDTLTDGIAQSELITLQNVPVTNGVFTVPLFFGSTFINNFKLRFLQIGVRPGTAPDTDPFTLLTPRQPLTPVPYAVNAQTAQTAFDVRLQLTSGAPLNSECNETIEYGRIKLDAGALRLYVCTATGWKSTVLQ